jgi:hypothetical protein
MERRSKRIAVVLTAEDLVLLEQMAAEDKRPVANLAASLLSKAIHEYSQKSENH